MALKNPVFKPDLIGALRLSSATPTAGQPVAVTAIVTNTGNTSASNFWIDFYIQPSSPPTAANQPWDSRCALTPCAGLSWHYTGSLAPSQSVTLSSINGNYDPTYSHWSGSFGSGVKDLYLYVDNWSDTGAVAGAVTESDETTNRAEVQLDKALAGWFGGVQVPQARLLR